MTDVADCKERRRIEVRLWLGQTSIADEDYARVIVLHPKNKATLGPLPYAVFADAGESGRPMRDSVNGEESSDVLCGTTRQLLLRLVHVCVGERVPTPAILEPFLNICGLVDPETKWRG